MEIEKYMWEHLKTIYLFKHTGVQKQNKIANSVRHNSYTSKQVLESILLDTDIYDKRSYLKSCRHGFNNMKFRKCMFLFWTQNWKFFI